MSTSLATVLSIIDELIPPALAESWDNVGLQIGDPKWPVKKISVALDPIREVIETCCNDNVDLLLTHHPLIFKPLKKIDIGSPQGALIEKAVYNRMAIYAAHTNFDRLADGLNDILAQKIKLQQPMPLEDGDDGIAKDPDNRHGMGRIGRLARAVSMKRLAEQLKATLGIDSIKMAGRPDLKVETVALCTGSGSSLMGQFLKSGAQVYISGDLRYHDARAVEESDLGLIDIGHFPSEHLMVEALARRLDSVFRKSNIEVEVTPCRVEKDPFIVI